MKPDALGSLKQIFFIGLLSILLMLSCNVPVVQNYNHNFIFRYRYQDDFRAHTYPGCFEYVKTAFGLANTLAQPDTFWWNQPSLSDTVIDYDYLAQYADINSYSADPSVKGILFSIKDAKDNMSDLGISTPGPNGWSYIFLQQIMNRHMNDDERALSLTRTCTHELGHQRGILTHDPHSGSNITCCVMHALEDSVIKYSYCGGTLAKPIFCTGHVDILKDVTW
jgi:hypothetical protein